MFRLTVLYNLPPGADEVEFLHWRLGEHQAENAAGPGVTHTDFGRVDYQWNAEHGLTPPPYRFMTIADFVDRASLDVALQSTGEPDDGEDDLSRIADALFLVSEILVST